MLRIGAHMSMAKGFTKAYVDAKEVVQGNTLQIFTKSPRGGKTKPLDPKDVQMCQEFQQKNNFFCAAHCSYLLNFTQSFSKDPWPNLSLIEDIERIHAVGGQAVVLHVGRRVGLPLEDVFKNFVYNIHMVLEKTKHLPTLIFMENTAGQGSEVGFQFEELGALLKAIHHPRVHVCLDTCHAFAAGYDLRDKKGVEKTMQEFDRHIGLEHLKMMHLNDSKKGLGEHRDRHEDIGHGQIGLNGILEIVRFAEKNNIPCVLETPMEKESYAEQVKKIRENL